MITSAIDALAHLITGSPRYFHAQGTLGEPGGNGHGDVAEGEGEKRTHPIHGLGIGYSGFLSLLVTIRSIG
jgi:hypothetical protein